MLKRTVPTWLLAGLMAGAALAQTLDPSTYVLTEDAARKYVVVTRELAAAGVAAPAPQGPVTGGDSAADLERYRKALDADPRATAALARANWTSREYVLFMAAAMQAQMAAALEQAGPMAKTMMPGGAPRVPPQNVAFMKKNVAMFEMSVDPRGNAGDGPELPMPAVPALPSQVIAAVPSLVSVPKTADCALPELQRRIEEGTKTAQELVGARYGNPGNVGLVRSDAERRLLARASDLDNMCIADQKSLLELDQQLNAERTRWREEVRRAGEEKAAAWRACPGIPGGKEPACERAVDADYRAKLAAAELKYLKQADGPFSAMIGRYKRCTQEREDVLAEARRLGVKGANVVPVLKPLRTAWQVPVSAVSTYSGVCRDVHQLRGA